MGRRARASTDAFLNAIEVSQGKTPLVTAFKAQQRTVRKPCGRKDIMAVDNYNNQLIRLLALSPPSLASPPPPSVDAPQAGQWLHLLKEKPAAAKARFANPPCAAQHAARESPRRVSLHGRCGRRGRCRLALARRGGALYSCEPFSVVLALVDTAWRLLRPHKALRCTSGTRRGINPCMHAGRR